MRCYCAFIAFVLICSIASLDITRISVKQSEEVGSSDVKRETEKRGWQEQLRKANAQRRKQEELRRKQEAERRKQEELRRKQEAERRKQEENRRRQQEAERRKQEGVRRKQEAEQRKQEENRRKQQEVERRKQEELRRKQEAERRKQEENRRKQQEAERRKQEELRQKQEAERRKQEENRRKQQEAERRKQEELRRKQEAEKTKEQQQKQTSEEAKKRKEEERRRKEKERHEEIRRKQEEERKKKIEEDKRKQEEAKRKEKQRQIEEEEKRKKEQWDNVYRDLQNKYGGDPKFWALQKDKIQDYYTESMKEKLANGDKLKAVEEDTFQNEYGRYKSRSHTTLIDILRTINTGNDVNDLDEGDVKKHAPTFSYEDHADEVYCQNTTNKNTHVCRELEKTNNVLRKRSLKQFDAEEAWERKKRDGKRNRIYLWMDRIVPYEIDGPLVDSTETIEHALHEIQGKTCIKFVRRTSQSNWIKFVKKSGCWSTVGKTFWSEGAQEISIGRGCMYKGIILHEVLHALGFYHEQSRPDRDRFVTIFWENILESERHNFNKLDRNEADTLDAPYDYASIMHYGKYSFSKDVNFPSIQSIMNPSQELGQRAGMSPVDVVQLNTLYNCHDTGNGWSRWSSYGPCDSSCKKSRSRFCMNRNDRTKCSNPVTKSLTMYGVDVENAQCSNEECFARINGHWNKWGSWGSCSVSCGEGIHTRERECTDPTPSNGGKPCRGLKVEKKKCLQRSCNEGPYDCTFDVENDELCSWQNGVADFTWSRDSGRTPSSGTGPEHDHTSGTGYYMFIESSSPARKGWKAWLVSPQMSADDRCMNISYSMYGGGMGTLNIKIAHSETKRLVTVFSQSGDRLKDWHTAQFDLIGSEPYKVIIEGIRGNSYQSDIAIDDIVILDGRCGEKDKGPVEPQLPTVSQVGCFRSTGYINGKRPFPQLKNFRQEIVWSRKSWLNETVLKCAAFAREHGYEYFGIEFYGECWTGPSDEINYGRDGEATDCYPHPSKKPEPYHVGADYTHFVYKWINLPAKQPDQNN